MSPVASSVRTCEPQLAAVVEDPAGDLRVVLAQQRPLAGRNLHAIQVVPCRVPIVQPDKNDVWLLGRYVVNESTDALRLGEIPRPRRVLPGRRTVVRVHRVDVEVLVAGLILNEQDVFAVPAPEVAADRPLGIGGHQLAGRERIPGLLHPDVAGVLVRLDERNELTIWRNLRAGNFRVSENQFTVDERRQVGSCSFGICRLCRRRRNHRGQRDEHENGEPGGLCLGMHSDLV